MPLPAALLIAAAVAPAPVARRTAPPPPVTVVATDYRLAIPDTLPAGATRFRLVDDGHEPHHFVLVRLGDGKTAADLAAAMRAPGPPPRWATFVGGPNAVAPGDTSLTTTVRLTPGRYAALCIIPSPDGVPHVAKGMISDVVVTRSSRSAPAAAHPAKTLTLFDYGFRSASPIRSTTHAVRVTNAGTQPHELVIARLADGKSAEDFARWAERMQGPPPGRFLGGVSPMAPGVSNDLALDLAPGRYALLCFVPDAKDGKPHVAHGMVREITVH